MGEKYGEQRNSTYPRYPGPWVELSGDRRLPKHFNLYLQLLPALTGLLLPLAALPAAAYHEHGWLGATVLVPYLFTLGVQIWSENWYNTRGSPMWPMTPIVHMTYRLWQLGRGSLLVSVLEGPVWLIYVQAYLAALWVFNFGAVMAWMPWMYRWHLQPDADSERTG
ncbi:hypothetical protein WJX81_002784 [Elliptochloris bilobata]|uniref:Uncharacterized protein n=1 Tax=Elliptochloris bilobata TaxID=381761 RepID=A0AAW1RH36_9CHLO